MRCMYLAAAAEAAQPPESINEKSPPEFPLKPATENCSKIQMWNIIRIGAYTRYQMSVPCVCVCLCA